jgi:acyl-[acyl-carrier-protein]-phospholipid O-acyltransferase/long-chain-fatty-acid--[acyl-carrier-protein] ligase
MIRVADIPVLASGKLDVQNCEKIARAGMHS